MLATSWFTISEGQEFLMVERHSNKAQRQRELDTHIFTMQVGRECELKMEWGINTIKSMPRDVLPPARLYLLKVPQPQEYRQLETKCSDTLAYGGHFSSHHRCYLQSEDLPSDR